MAGFGWRWSMLGVLTIATGCPDDPVGVAQDSESASTGSTSATVADTTADASGAASTTGVADSTATTTGIPADSTTADATTGGTTGEGKIRLLVGAGGQLGAGADTLSIIDYDAGQLSNVAVHEPLPAGRSIGNWGLSSTLAYLYFRTSDPATPNDDHLLVARYTDGRTSAPVRVNVAPAPDPGRTFELLFTPDDGALAFFSVQDAAGTNPGLWIAAAGGSDPGPPSRLHPPLAAGDDVNSDLEIGPSDAGMTLTGDFSGGGLNNLYLASADPTRAGTVTQLSAHDDPAQAIAFGSTRWVPDASGVIYRADTDVDALNELWWVGLTGGTPTAPVKINDPLAPGQSLLSVRLAPDSRAVAFWLGEGINGEIVVAALDGASPGIPMVISTPTPAAAFAPGLRWSDTGQALIYTAEHNTVGNRDAYYVDMAGPTPGTPERINGALLPGAEVVTVLFGPDGYIYYIAAQDMPGAELYRVPLIGGVPSVPERISGELVDNGTLSGEVLFAPDGGSLLYTATQDSTAHQELYRIELGARPGPSTKVNGPLAPGFDVQFASRFSADGSVIAYRIHDGESGDFPLLLEDLTDGPGNPIEAAAQVQGFSVLPTD